MSTLLMIMIMTAAGMLRSVQQDLVQLCAVVGLCNYKVLLLYLSIFFLRYLVLLYLIFHYMYLVANCYLLFCRLKVYSRYLVALLSDNLFGRVDEDTCTGIWVARCTLMLMV